MARIDTLGNFLTDVADAIREKKGTTDTILASNFDTEIASIEGGVDINEYLSDTITNGSNSLGGWAKTIKKMRSPLTIEGTGAEYMFYNCPVNELPQLDTSNVTNMSHMFTSCTNLTTIPQINTSNVTNMDYMFSGCANLTTIPQLDTSNVTDMRYMFSGCTNLTTTTSQLDTSNVTDMRYMFNSCTNLTTIPQINTSNVTNMDYMFSGCANLTTIPQLDTSNVTDMSNMFSGCRKITTIPQLNGEKLINVYRNFYSCTSLENFNGLINLGQEFSTSQNANYYNYTLDLSSSTSLTEQSIINILNNLYDIATKGCKTQTVILGATNLAKLTSTEGQQALANAQSKGWNIN